MTYYREALAAVHHLGYGFHGDACAPGVLALLEATRPGPVEVLELGWLAESGVDAEVSTRVGDHRLPDGMVWVVGRKLG